MQDDDVAIAAARLVVEEGLEYGEAKRKAARVLGRRGGRRAELPSNEAVEDEVRVHLSLFHADTQPAELRALRETAAHWLARLAEFRPHLAGAVWRGTATRRSALVVDLYCDDPKAAEIGLINEGLDFDPGGIDLGGGEGLQVLTLSVPCRALGQPVPLHLVVHDHDDLRGALKPDAAGRTWRGDAAALKRLLEDEERG